MSEHRATIDWQRGNADFTHATYPRAHTMTFANGLAVDASAAPDYQGDADRVDPEAMLVGALSSCHMLTFLALAAKKRLVVDSYTDDASGVLGKNEAGRMAVTAVTLRPRIVFGTSEASPEEGPDAETVQAMHDKAHEYCFIANTVNCAVTVEAGSP